MDVTETQDTQQDEISRADMFKALKAAKNMLSKGTNALPDFQFLELNGGDWPEIEAALDAADAIDPDRQPDPRFPNQRYMPRREEISSDFDQVLELLITIKGTLADAERLLVAKHEGVAA